LECALIHFGLSTTIKCREETGYTEDVINYMWEKYSSNSDVYNFGFEVFYDVYVFIHMYPCHRQADIIFGKSHNYISIKVLPAMRIMANLFDEIHWEDRLDFDNHLPHFDSSHTGIVDTFPVQVVQPQSSELRHLLYNGKYGCCVVKFVMMIDFKGRIIFFDGPFTGNSYDGHIWLSTVSDHPMFEEERMLADGHFTIVEEATTPIRADQIESAEQGIFNFILQHYRARIEHINAYFVRHNMFRCVFRGTFETLKISAIITAHTSNRYLCENLHYHPFGFWPHIFL